MDGSRIWNKTVSFSFENGVVWTGSKRGCDYGMNSNVISQLQWLVRKEAMMGLGNLYKRVTTR